MPGVYSASEQFYHVSKVEYDYETSRSSALDNKVSMTLAFCGVVFLFFTNYLNVVSIWKNYVDHSCLQCILRFLSSSLQIACLVCFAVCIVKLFLILKPREYCRLDPYYLLDETLPEWEPKQAYMYLGKKYTEFATFNREVNEKRANEYSNSIRWLLIAILLCVVNETIKFNFL